MLQHRDRRTAKQPHGSRERYGKFVKEYRQGRLDDTTDAARDPDAARAKHERRGKRREYMRDYLRWLWPHRYAAGVFAFLALLTATLQMIEPLFMRFIVDRVLLVS